MTYHPRIRHIDPVLSLAEDLVSLEDLSGLRLDNITGAAEEGAKQIRLVMKTRAQLIQKIITATACSHLTASEALCQAINRAVKRL